MKQPSQQSRPKIAAAIPAFNEEEYIGTVVLKTRQYVDEAIVVDMTSHGPDDPMCCPTLRQEQRFTVEDNRLRK